MLSSLKSTSLTMGYARPVTRVPATAGPRGGSEANAQVGEGARPPNEATRVPGTVGWAGGQNNYNWDE